MHQLPGVGLNKPKPSNQTLPWSRGAMMDGKSDQQRTALCGIDGRFWDLEHISMNMDITTIDVYITYACLYSLGPRFKAWQANVTRPWSNSAGYPLKAKGNVWASHSQMMRPFQAFALRDTSPETLTITSFRECRANCGFYWVKTCWGANNIHKISIAIDKPSGFGLFEWWLAMIQSFCPTKSDEVFVGLI